MKVLDVVCSISCFYLCACAIKRPQNVSNLAIGDILFSLPAECSIDRDIKNLQQSGSFSCIGQHFYYSFGVEENAAPLTLKEEFSNAFKGKYHSTFFDKIYIDTKVHRFFRDSVKIIEVGKISEYNDQLLMTCSVCNGVAKLIFRGKLYYYPYYIDHSSDKNSLYIIESDTLNGYNRKVWLSKSDSLCSGVLFTSKDKSKTDKNLLILTKEGQYNTNVKNILFRISPRI